MAMCDEVLANWLKNLASELLAHMDYPHSHWRKLRSSNMFERANEELRRQVRVLRIFPNSASCLRLVTALAMEFGEDRQTDRRYLNMAQMAETEDSGWKHAG